MGETPAAATTPQEWGCLTAVMLDMHVHHMAVQLHMYYLGNRFFSAGMCCLFHCSYQTPLLKPQHTGSWRPFHTWDKVQSLLTSHFKK